MLPRSRSIFHIEELASSCSRASHATAITTTAGGGGGSSSRRSEVEASTSSSSSSRRTSSDNNRSAPLVGLQLLIKQRCASEQLGAHLVTKQSIRSRGVAAPSQLGFWKTCHLCNKELKPQMDIYVYRGEQGFCSPECRQHHMLVEERREFEAYCRRKPFRKPHHVHPKSKNTIRRWNQNGRMQVVA